MDKAIEKVILIAKNEEGYLEKNQTVSLTVRQQTQDLLILRNIGEI